MVLLNTTVNIEPEIEDKWLHWMKNYFVDKVLNTGLFYDWKIYNLLNEAHDGKTFSVQFFTESQSKLHHYLNHHAESHHYEMSEKFKGKLVSFQTYLKEV